MRSLLCAAVALAGCTAPGTNHTLDGDGGLAADGGRPDLLLPFAPLGTRCTGAAATDGQACSGGCGAGTTCAGSSAADMRCYATCNPTADAPCPCGRRCASIGSSQTHACLPANGPGERCGNNAQGRPYGYGTCQQGLSCAGSKGARYCVYRCETSSNCPALTSCKSVVSGAMVAEEVCWFNESPTGQNEKPLGAACARTDFCVRGSMCVDGRCRPLCNGPTDPGCASGTCSAVSDGPLVFAYVCR